MSRRRRRGSTIPTPSSSPLVVDGHTDLLLELVHRSGEERPFATHWLPKLATGGVGVQVCPVYVDVPDLPDLALRRALGQVAAFHRAARECARDVLVVRERGDLDRLDGRIGLLLALEGVEPLGYDPALADVFWELGVRMVSLTWNRRNPFADGAGEAVDGGLSELGRTLVRRLAALGAVLDLAHASERTFADVLAEAPEATVVVSHANCRAVVASPRNLSDDQLRALAARGGVVGVLAHPFVLSAPTIDALVDHVDHVVATVGLDHVALGGDFMAQIVESGAVANEIPLALMPAGMGIGAAVAGLRGPEDYPALAAAL
ncbi:MAG: thermostable dipeptidase, partial [Actinobacteria bacterium]|nr:thermostable dipeptidase [Actinomycetota bacterium]